MEKTEKKKPSVLTIVLLALLVVAAVVIVVLLLRDKPVPEKEIITVGPKIETDESQPVEKSETVISLPGYGGMNFKANTKEQNLNIPNPPENTCLIKISLILSDGTVLWESEDVQPGYYSTPIVLTKELEAGDYEAYLKYDCFTADGSRTPLNGAESALTLHVQ